MNTTANPLSDNSQIATILVVDDDPANLSVMSDYLKEYKYRVIVARDGESALARAEYGKPDIILLDVLMPKMDGYETCRLLKTREPLRDIPVIFMTALAETSDKVAAFQAGGVDYVTKPFQQEEVLARVRAHLELRANKRELEKSYQALRHLEEMRDKLVHMVIHDMRSPLWGIRELLKLLTEEEPGLSEDGRDRLNQVVATAGSLLEMVSAILDVSKMESGAMKLNIGECSIEKAVRQVFTDFKALSRSRQMIFVCDADAPAVIRADAGLVARVIENLVVNAIKFTPESEGIIRVHVAAVGDRVKISVEDNGYGIPPEHRERVFEKFGQVEDGINQKKYSTGLGLPFCRMAIEAHGGRITLDSQEKGSRFCIELPMAGPA